MFHSFHLSCLLAYSSFLFLLFLFFLSFPHYVSATPVLRFRYGVVRVSVPVATVAVFYCMPLEVAAVGSKVVFGFPWAADGSLPMGLSIGPPELSGEGTYRSVAAKCHQ